MNFLITGASSGLGKELFNSLSKNSNYNFFLLSKNIDELKKIKKINKQVRIYHLDLNEIEKTKTIANQILEDSQNKIDVIICNAAEGAFGTIDDIPTDKFLSNFNVNFFSQIRLTQLVLKYLKNSKKSSIINIGSISAKIADRGTLAYGCSKIALMHATKIMANEFANYKIRVNGICPNATNTKMLKKMDPKSKDALISRSFMKKICEPIDVANLILYLSSKNSEYINGQIIFMDGGMEC